MEWLLIAIAALVIATCGSEDKPAEEAEGKDNELARNSVHLSGEPRGVGNRNPDSAGPIGSDKRELKSPEVAPLNPPPDTVVFDAKTGEPVTEGK